MKETSIREKQMIITPTGRKKQPEIYIVEYVESDTAQETVSTKLERLMLNEAQRVMEARAS